MREPSDENLKLDARDDLLKYSLVVQRAYENGIPFPQDWKEYGTTLRLIAQGEQTGPLPSKPATYPDGTPT